MFIFISNVSFEFLQRRVLDVMASVALWAADGAPAIDFQSLGLCRQQVGLTAAPTRLSPALPSVGQADENVWIF